MSGSSRPAGALRRRLDGRPVPVLAVVAAVGAALVVAVPIVVVSVLTWIAAAVDSPSAGPVGGAIRSGVLVWLAGNHVPVSLGGVHLTIAPLGVLVAVLACLFVGGRRLGREVPAARDALTGAGEIALCYAVLLAIAAVASGTASGSGANPLLAGVVGLLVGIVGAGAGAAAGSPAVRERLAGLLPDWARSAASGGVAGAAVLVLVAAVVAAVALFTGRERVLALVGAFGSDPVELVGLGLLNLVFVPNVVGWVVAFLLGPGFGLGAGTLVSPLLVDLGQMPPIPLLGAVPAEGTPAVPFALVFAAGVVAALAGAMVTAVHDHRRGSDWRDLGFDQAMLRPASGGLLAALLVIAFMLLSGGGLGRGRLGWLGPEMVPSAALAVALFGLAGAVVGGFWWLLAWLGRRADV